MNSNNPGICLYRRCVKHGPRCSNGFCADHCLERHNTLISVAFAAIDAKDDAYTGYDPAAPIMNDRPLPIGKQNVRPLARLVAEYLTRLAALQDELSEKYSGQFVEEPEENVRKEYAKARAEAALEFSGRQAWYYT